jgi:hypothetical protein
LVVVWVESRTRKTSVGWPGQRSRWLNPAGQHKERKKKKIEGKQS